MLGAMQARLTPQEIGANVREVRRRKGLSQSEVAAFAKVSERTLRRLEQGVSLTFGTLEKVCVALGWNATEASTSGRFLPIEDAKDFRLHGAEETYWYTTDDHRKQVPPDDLVRIQDPTERRRLGRLGLVDMFVGTFRFSVPDAPAMALFELYAPVRFGGGSYRHLVLYCVRGDVTFTVDGEPVRVTEGGAIYLRKQPVDLRPTFPIGPKDMAPLLLHAGSGLRKAPGGPDK